MIKLVLSNKKLLLAVNKLPLIRRCFVYDYSKLNAISDDDFYNLVFSHIIVSNGLTKTTKSDRFRDLDEVTLGLLKEMNNATFHDIGVSNGVTSLELYNKIERGSQAVNFFISDKYAKIFYKGRAVKKFFDADGNLISVNFLFLHLSPHIGKIFFLSRWLFKFFDKKIRVAENNCKEVLLLAPDVYKKIQEGKITLLEFDVFETKLTRPFNFLRCMNVLMPAYFSTEGIKKGVYNLQQNLSDGGYLLLGRTDSENINHATFYRQKDNELKGVKNINKGFDYNNPA